MRRMYPAGILLKNPGDHMSPEIVCRGITRDLGEQPVPGSSETFYGESPLLERAHRFIVELILFFGDPPEDAGRDRFGGRTGYTLAGLLNEYAHRVVLPIGWDPHRKLVDEACHYVAAVWRDSEAYRRHCAGRLSRKTASDATVLLHMFAYLGSKPDPMLRFSKEPYTGV